MSSICPVRMLFLPFRDAVMSSAESESGIDDETVDGRGLSGGLAALEKQQFGAVRGWRMGTAI